jgi:ABC-2 type transport system permease protein
MRARWRITLNTMRRASRWRTLTIVLVLGAVVYMSISGLGFSWFLSRGIVELTGQQEAADVIPSAIISGALALCLMVSFTVALAALYLSADLDLLLASPAPRRAVFFAKLLGGLLPTYLIVVALTLVPLAGHGLALGYGFSYAAAVVAALVLMPLIPMAVGGLSVMIIVRRVSAHRLGEVVGLIVASMTLGLALIAGSAREIREVVSLADLLSVLERYRSPFSPAEWLTSAVVEAGRGDYHSSLLWFGLIAAVSACALLPLVFLGDRLYFEGWLHMQSADGRRAAKGGRLPWNRVDRPFSLGRPSGWLGRFSQPSVAVIRKDFRTIPRDLTNLAQVLSPLAIGLFFVLQQLLYPQAVGGAEFLQPLIAPLLAMLSAILASGVSAMITVRLGLTAFSSEGRAYWILKAAPLRRRDLIVGKFVVAYTPYLISALCLVVLLQLARLFATARAGTAPFFSSLAASFDPGLLLYAGFVSVVLGVGAISITLALGAARPNLHWDSPHEMMTPDVGCLSLVLYGAYMLVAGLALAVPLGVSRFPVLEQSWLVWLVGLGTGVGLTAVVSAGAWRVAYLELDHLGE